MAQRRFEIVWFCFPVTYASVVHSTWPSRVMWRTHAPTFNKWHKKKKVTLHMLTHGAVRGCGLTSLAVCIDNEFHDIRERNVTIRSEIWTINIRSLGFRDIWECVPLWGLILWNLGCSEHNWEDLCIKLKYQQTCASNKLKKKGRSDSNPDFVDVSLY